MVCVFARKTSEPLASLVKQIDAKIGEDKALKAFVVLTPAKGLHPTEVLAKLASDSNIRHVPLTIGESPDGPPDYELAHDADITVLMWKHHRVEFNHAFKGDLSDQDIQAIMADVPKLLKK